MLKVSVSNLELFRIWQLDEDLDVGWLMDRLLCKVEQTPQQRAGEAFHKALETAKVGEREMLEAMGYRFHIAADCQIVHSWLNEIPIAKQYGELIVTGRVDSCIGRTVIDYKTGAQFDPDRLLSSYQWRFYLDAVPAAVGFQWKFFKLMEMDDLHEFMVTEYHEMGQSWYPELHSDCRYLAHEYWEFAKDIPALVRMSETGTAA
jgi:hypothetical protein